MTMTEYILMGFIAMWSIFMGFADHRIRRRVAPASDKPEKKLLTPHEVYRLELECGIIPPDTPPPDGAVTYGPPVQRLPNSGKCIYSVPLRITQMPDGATLTEYKKCDCSKHKHAVVPKPPVVSYGAASTYEDLVVWVPDYKDRLTEFNTSKGPRYGYTCNKCGGWWTGDLGEEAASKSLGHYCLQPTTERR